MKNKTNIGMSILLTLIMILTGVFVMNTKYEVNASAIDGTGTKPSDSIGGAAWHEIQGAVNTREAWNKFLTHQAPGLSSLDYVTRTVNRNKGFKRPNGTYETMVESCQKSEYIWYYGHTGKDWKSSTGKWYRDGDWFSAGRRTNTVGWKEGTRRGDANATWNNYLRSSDSRWSNGDVVLVCSGSFRNTTVAKRNIVIEAGSKSVPYDGKTHSVTSDKLITGSLKNGHRYTSTTNTSAVNEGVYSVPVRGVNIVNSSGKNVNSEYNISTRPGQLKIYAQPVIAQDKKSDEDRCEQKRWEDPVKGPVWVDLTVNPTFQGENGKLKSQSIGGVNTQLGDYVASGQLSGLKNITDWNNWKAKFISIRDNNNGRTPELTFTDENQIALSRYGGVLNATRRYRDSEYQVETCQPEQRKWEEKIEYRNDENGKQYVFKDDSKYGEWQDDGVRRITNSSIKASKGKDLHYQILSVNCNIDQFNAARNASGLATTVNAIGDGSGSAMMTTASTDDINKLPFGKTNTGNAALNRTGQRGFYTDGTSCDVFTCSADKLIGANNDAINNIGENPLFTEVDDNKENTGKPKRDDSIGKDYLVFFRDNKDRNVRADLWYPNNYDANGLTVDSKSPAVKTFVKLAKGGTPELDITTISPNGDNKNNIKQVDKEYEWNGEINNFNMKSQWASEESSPHELGISWQYQANAKNIMPVKIDGYKITSFKKESGVDNEFNYKFAANCEYSNDKNSAGKAIIADRPYANSNLISKNKFPSIGSDAIRALFTRAVSDID